MELENLIDKVETWISRFCTIITNDFVLMEYHLWKFIWMCISELGQRYPSKHFSYNNLMHSNGLVSVSWEWENVSLFDYNSNQMLQWLTQIIESFAMNVPLLFVIEWRPRPSRSSEMNKVILYVSTKSQEETQNYVYFMQCLFPDSFESSAVKISGRPRNRYPSQTARLRMHYTWTMTPSTYQRCLQLFPAWPVVVHYGYDDELLELISTFMIPDLARMCIMYLPTRNDYLDLVELPEKH